MLSIGGKAYRKNSILEVTSLYGIHFVPDQLKIWCF